jgi:hypothetical protein
VWFKFIYLKTYLAGYEKNNNNWPIVVGYLFEHTQWIGYLKKIHMRNLERPRLYTCFKANLSPLGITKVDFFVL